MRELEIAGRLINLKFRDVIVIVTGAPGGLTIIDMLPVGLKDELSDWLKDVIAIYPDYMAKHFWMPLGDVLSTLGFELPDLWHDPLSGLLALLVMFLSCMLTGNRESVGRLMQRAYRIQHQYQLKPDAWINGFIYPGALIFSGLFFWPLFVAISGGFGGSVVAGIVPGLLFLPFLMGAIRGFYKSAAIRGEDTPLFDQIFFVPAAAVSAFGTAGGVLLCFVLAQLDVSGLEQVLYVGPWWVGALTVWLAGFLVAILVSANWRALPIMLLWAGGLLVSDRVVATF